MKPVSFAEATPATRIELAGGHCITLAAIDQSLTYGRLLVGLPTPEINERCKEAALRTVASRFGTTPNPYLIAPAPIGYAVQTQLAKLTRARGLEPAGPIETKSGERLPQVTCIARFKCPALSVAAAGPGLFAYSAATLVWFQEAFALPIAPEVIAAIRALRWESISADVSD